jgi:hypothetical protein
MNNCKRESYLYCFDNQDKINLCSCDISLCELSEAYKICILNVKKNELDRVLKIKELNPLYDYSISFEKITYSFEMQDALHIPYCQGLDHSLYVDIKYDSLYEKVSIFLKTDKCTLTI